MELYKIEKVERRSQRLTKFSELDFGEFFTGIGNGGLCQKITEDKFINWHDSLKSGIRLRNLVGSRDESCHVRVGIEKIQWFVDD